MATDTAAHSPPTRDVNVTTKLVSPHSSPPTLERSQSASTLVVSLGPEVPAAPAVPEKPARAPKACGRFLSTDAYGADQPKARTGLDLSRVVRPVGFPMPSPDTFLSNPALFRHMSLTHESYSLDHRDHHHNRQFYIAATSSAESFESDAIATPWPRRSSASDTKQLPELPTDDESIPDLTKPAMTVPHFHLPHFHFRPSSSAGHTDGEEEHHSRSLWTPRRSKKTFWGGARHHSEAHSHSQTQSHHAGHGHPSSSPSRPPKRLVSTALPLSPRSRSPDSGYTQSSSPVPRSSSDHSFNSGPSIRVTESPRGVPRLCFTEGEDSLLGPSLTLFSRLHSQSNDSVTTITGKSPPTSTAATPHPFPKVSTNATPRKSTSSTTSSLEPSPIARKRRLNALRRLVPNLNFDQPWSVIDRSEAEDEPHFWACGAPYPAPQLDRLSLGSQFQVDAVCRLTSESTVSLPSQSTCSDTRSDTWRRTRRYSRSMVSVNQVPRHAKSDDESSYPPHWPERPISPPMLWTRASSPSKPAMTFRSPKSGRPEIPIRSSSVYGSGTSHSSRKTASMTRVGNSYREPPHPPRRRKESFNIQYSGYSKSLRPLTPRLTDAAPTWRESLMHDTVYDRISAGPDGHLEVKRQEVIWEMCETEQVFVRACRDVIRLFAAPLRVAQGQWMSGISPAVCELFEALEVIAHTHHELSTHQQVDRRSSDVIDVAAFVAQFRAWVEGLSCHEPYIVLFNPVTQYVEEATRDETSTFGEFLRMQMRDKALGSLTVGSMLLKPIQRLTKYPLFLRRLLEATPEDHPAHHDVAELLDVTEAILENLEACKAREDDLIQVTSLEERLDGLPLGFELAVRGRRLIGHCQVTRIHREQDTLMSRSSSLRALRATLSSTVKSHSSGTSVNTGSSSGSHNLSTESQKIIPTSMTSSIHMLSPGPSRPHSRAASRAVSRAASPVRERTIHRSTSIASSLGETFRTPTKASLSIRKPARDTVYTMFLFNDMVAIATTVGERKGLFKTRKDATRFRIVSPYDGGIGSIEDVREVKDWPGQEKHDRAFTLSLRVPGHHTVVATYVLSPLGSLPRRAQRTAALGGPGLETVDQVVGALSMARTAVESDSERGESEHE